MQVKSRINFKATATLLRKKWKASELTQEAIATRLKMSQEQCSRLLRGQSRRDAQGLRKLCALFGASLIFHKERFTLSRYPAVQGCLVDILDGTRKRERAVVRLLRSARALTYP